MKQTHFRQRPSGSGQSRGVPGLRAGAQSGGEVGISAAQGEEAVPSRGPPGLRGAVIVEASPRHARAAVGGCPRGLVWPGGECHRQRGSAPLRPAPVMPSRLQPRRVPAPGSAARARDGASCPALAPGSPLHAWALACAPGVARLRGLSAGADVPLAFFQTPTKFRSKSFGDSLSLPRLWEEVASATLPSRGPLGPSWLRSPHRPWSLCAQPALGATRFCITSKFNAYLYPCTPAPPGNL